LCWSLKRWDVIHIRTSTRFVKTGFSSLHLACRSKGRWAVYSLHLPFAGSLAICILEELLISLFAWSSRMVSFLFSPFLSGIAPSVQYTIWYMFGRKKRYVLQTICLTFYSLSRAISWPNAYLQWT
jgi:hypothetical protein